MVLRTRYTHVLTKKEYTNTLIDQSVGKTMIPAIELPSKCKLLFVLSGTSDCTGAITVNGVNDDVNISESIRFTGPSQIFSTNMFDRIINFTSRGLSGEDPIPNLKINSVNIMLQPEYIYTERRYKCAFSQIGGSRAMWIVNELGLTDKEVYYIRTHAIIQAGDEFYCNGLPGIKLTSASSINAIRLPNSNVIAGYEFYAVRKD